MRPNVIEIYLDASIKKTNIQVKMLSRRKQGKFDIVSTTQFRFSKIEVTHFWKSQIQLTQPQWTPNQAKGKIPRSNPTWASITSNGAGDDEDSGADGSTYADENKLKETQPSNKTVSGTCTDAGGIGIKGFTPAGRCPEIWPPWKRRWRRWVGRRAPTGTALQPTAGIHRLRRWPTPERESEVGRSIRVVWFGLGGGIAVVVALYDFCWQSLWTWCASIFKEFIFMIFDIKMYLSFIGVIELINGIGEHVG